MNLSEPLHEESRLVFADHGEDSGAEVFSMIYSLLIGKYKSDNLKVIFTIIVNIYVVKQWKVLSPLTSISLLGVLFTSIK